MDVPSEGVLPYSEATAEGQLGSVVIAYASAPIWTPHARHPPHTSTLVNLLPGPPPHPPPTLIDVASLPYYTPSQ
jgi:hypothetical protein